MSELGYGSAPMAPDGSASGQGAGNPGSGPGNSGGFDWQSALGQTYNDYKPMLDSKGWQGPVDALRSYQQLEKVLGAPNKIAVPRGNAAPEEWEQVYRALGRPEQPSGYQFHKPENVEGYADELAQQFSEAAFKAGLSTSQAQKLHDWWLAQAGQMQTAQASKSVAEQRWLDAELSRQWGTQKEERLDLARRAARHFGFGAEQLDRLAGLLGDLRLVDGFARMGENLLEDKMAGQGGGDAIGPAVARAELKRLQADSEFRAALFDRSHVGHDAAVERFRRLSAQTDPTAVVRNNR